MCDSAQQMTMSRPCHLPRIYCAILYCFALCAVRSWSRSRSLAGCSQRTQFSAQLILSANHFPKSHSYCAQRYCAMLAGCISSIVFSLEIIESLSLSSWMLKSPYHIRPPLNRCTLLARPIPRCPVSSRQQLVRRSEGQLAKLWVAESLGRVTRRSRSSAARSNIYNNFFPISREERRRPR